MSYGTFSNYALYLWGTVGVELHVSLDYVVSAPSSLVYPWKIVAVAAPSFDQKA